MGIEIEDVKKALSSGLVMLRFIKENGEERFAVGSTKNELLPDRNLANYKKATALLDKLIMAVDNTQSHGNKVLELEDPNVAQLLIDIRSLRAKMTDPTIASEMLVEKEWVNFFDFSVNGWRKFKIDRLIEYKR